MSFTFDKNKKDILLKNVDSFKPRDIFTCGQAFRWYEEDDESYTTIAHGRILNVKKINDDILFKNTSEEDFNNIWINYFDLERDYSDVKKRFEEDELLKAAMEYGEGIRVLNQDPFETIISFIISANNQIPRIKASIEKISNLYGNPIGEYNGRLHHSFPSSKVLSQVDPLELREECRVGFRDVRIVEASKLIEQGHINLDDIFLMEIEDARKELMKLPGVGPKVADCCLLFAFKKSESFPVDLWIKRVMEELYLKKECDKKYIASEGRRLFGNYAGFAQQYLFYYGRENNIGKK